MRMEDAADYVGAVVRVATERHTEAVRLGSMLKQH